MQIRGSSALSPDKKLFSFADRGSGVDNVRWIAAQLDELKELGADATYVLLVGGTSVYDYRLQFAQSQLRHDMTPSHWSHAALISTVSRSVGASRILETSLEPDEGFGLPSMYNGVQGAQLKRYQEPSEYPNIALIRVPVPVTRWRSEIKGQKSVLHQFAEQRVVVDVPALLVEWLAYVWGAGDQTNPLIRGRGIPSAAVIESLVGAAGYDVCPGIDSTASSPEAIWQSAKWWQEYFISMNLEPMSTRYFIEGQGPRSKSISATKGDTSTKSPTVERPPSPRTPLSPRFRQLQTAALFKQSR